MIVYLNGKLLPEARAHISIHDHGFLVGDGVYETMRVYDGKVFLSGEHLLRLKNSLRGIDLKLPFPMEKLGKAMNAVIKANRQKEAALRLTVTRGPGLFGFDPTVCKTPTVLITSRPFHGYPPKLQQQGMTVILSSLQRNSPQAIPPTVKTISGMNNILAKIEANNAKAHEALFRSDDGSIAEGTISNIFLVKGGQLFTPVLDGRQLPGVTRALVCRLARDKGIRVNETKIFPKDLLAAESLFLTSSLMEIMPITKLLINGKKRSYSVNSTVETLRDCYKRFTHS